MKLVRPISWRLALALALIVLPRISLANPQEGQSDVMKATNRYLRLLTFPDDYPVQQRIIAAVSVAVGATRTTDPSEILEAYLIAGAQADRLKRRTEYNWSGTEWVPNTRKTNTFDGSGVETESLWEDWDGNGWVNSKRDVSTYESELLGTVVTQVWVTDHWENDEKSIFTFTGDGQIEVAVYQTWNGSDWVNENRSTYTYTDGKTETVTSEIWNGSDWDPESLTTYTYEGDRVSDLLIQSWEGGAWVNSARIVYTIDGSGHVTESLTQSWEDGAWVNSLMSEYTYDGSGNQTVSSTSYWIDDMWTAWSIDSSSYENGMVTERIHNSLLFPSRSRTTYSYDGENLIEQIRQSWVEGLSASGDWVNSGRTSYEYEAGGTAVQISDEPAPSGWELDQNYPNPFNPSTSIRYSLQRTSNVEITVYNMLGQTVRTLENGVQTPGVYETTWDGTDANGNAVATGMYLYRISTNDFTETRKMMLLK